VRRFDSLTSGAAACRSGRNLNPRGRPKADKSLGTAIKDALEEKVKMRRDGKERVISSLRAFALRLVADAIQSKASAQKMLVELIVRFVPTTASAAPTGNAEDTKAWLREKLDQMAKRMQQKLPGEK
jgi:Family of unknown function (DUF5681)